jgi:acyl-CoA synthetase (NDP forming)
MMDAGIAPLMGLETALKALKAAQTAPGQSGWRPTVAIGPRATRMLDEAAGKVLLDAAAVPIPKGIIGATIAEARDKSRGLTPPLVLKGLGFAHKTEAGAVRLGLTTIEGQAEMPGATGYLVEEMVVAPVAEILLGLRRDQVYGVTLTIGLGGVTAELLADTVTLVLPVGEAEVLAAMRQLKLWPLLDGYRGRPTADMSAVAGIAVRLGELMLDRPDLEEIEINPILVRQEGAVAVDALIREAV